MEAKDIFILNLDDIVVNWAEKKLEDDAKLVDELDVIVKRYKERDKKFHYVLHRDHVGFDAKGPTQFVSSQIETAEMPESLIQRVLKTTFKNHTDTKQTHVFKCERSTQVLEKVNMKTGFKVGGKAGVKLGYPKIASISLGINSELSIGNDTDTCKTHTLTWNTENSVVVPQHTKLTAEMNVEDREFTGTFQSNVAVSGVFEVEIKDRKNIDTIHCARGTIGEIINTWTESPSGGKLENVELIDNGAIAIWPVTGSYYYRCGVELTIETRTEPLTTGLTEYAKICD